MEPPCVHLFEIGIFITVEWALKNGTKIKPAEAAVKAIMRQKRSGLIVDVCDAAAVRGRKAVFKSSGRPKNGGTLWACKDESNRRGPEAAEGEELACCHGAKQANRSGKKLEIMGVFDNGKEKKVAKCFNQNEGSECEDTPLCCLT
jgi:hypothetical protein